MANDCGAVPVGCRLTIVTERPAVTAAQPEGRLHHGVACPFAAAISCSRPSCRCHSRTSARPREGTGLALTTDPFLCSPIS